MAMTFTANNYVTVSGTWGNPNTATVCFWVYFNSVGASNRCVGSDDNWEIRSTTDWSASPKFTNEIYSSTATQPPAMSLTTVVANTWFHVACTVAPAGGGNHLGQIYINGLFEASGTSSDTATGTSFGIGNRPSATAGQCCNGVMDDIRVYTRVLSATEIQTIYYGSGQDSIYHGLQNRWMLNEFANGTTSSGTNTIIDMIGNNNGTPTLQSGSDPVYFSSRLTNRRQA